MSRPILYSNAAIPEKQPYLSILSIEERGRDALIVRVPGRHRAVLAEALSLELSEGAEDLLVRIDYRTPSQIVFHAGQPARFYHFHCQTRTRGDIRSIAPNWSEIGGDLAAGTARIREHVPG